MSFESNLNTLLKTLCPRVAPVKVELGTAKPYVTWQPLGGESLRFLDNTAADQRNIFLQVNVWSYTLAESMTLIRQIEDTLCESTLFTASPEGELMSVFEGDTNLHGCVQRFSIYAAR